MGATVSPFVFKSVAYQGGRIIPVPGPLISLFALTILLLFVLGGVELKRKLAVAKDVYRAQVLYVAIGYTAMLVLLILTQFIFVVVFHNTFFVSWGPIFTLPFIITTSYAILRHHLFNIRVIATELFTASIVLVFLFNIFFSRDLHTFIFNSVLFIFVSIFGIFLIQGTLREIRELERVSATKSEFISIASHQLRTPLTATKGYISMLLEGTYGTIAQKQMEVLKRVYASNERLANIVEDLLNVSRMDQGRLVYTFVPTDLVHVIEEVIDELKITAETKHIDLVFEKPKDGVSFIVPADKEKLHQVIANLVDNAIKYTMKGSVRVMLKKNDYPSTITIIIQDTGIGLTAEDKRKIFEMFSRGQEGMRVNTKGSGLGLFIAKTIAEAHKGTLRAESAGRNKGSSFVIELPAEKEKTDVAAAFLSDLQ